MGARKRTTWAKQRVIERGKEALLVAQARAKRARSKARYRKLGRERREARLREAATSGGDGTSSTSAASFERAVSVHATDLALTIYELTSGKGLEYQKAVLERILEEPLLGELLPQSVVQIKDLERCRVVCNGVASAWSCLKFAVGRDHHLARSVIEAAVISLEDDNCVEAAARCIGMNKRTLRRAVTRRRALNDGLEGEIWAKAVRAKRRDALQQNVIDVVVAWWTDETRVSPSKKDVRKKRVGVKRFISHAGHWLEKSQLDFYTSFKRTHSHMKVSFVSFRNLRPFFVRRLRDFNSCCCRSHQEMAEITTAFNTMRSSKFHVGAGTTICICGCDSVCCNMLHGHEITGPVSCQAKYHNYNRSTQLWEQCLCAKATDLEWHDLKCIKGECDNCGFHLIPLCDAEQDLTNDKILEWKKFEMVTAGTTKLGDPKKVLRLQHKQTTTQEFLEYAKAKIPPFIIHQHTAKWQDAQYRACLEQLKPGEVMSLIDYAENYSFKGQNEIQSEHWYNFQISILVHITYTVNSAYDPANLKSKRLQTRYYYYISDDPKHDSLFVQYSLNLHWREIREAGYLPTRHIVWSDGCACQFKGATAFFYVARYPSLTVCDALPRGCQMDWHFWGSGHGKGPHDGAGACLKSTLRKEQLKSTSVRLHNAQDVCEFLSSSMNQPHAAYHAARRDVERKFHLIGKTEVSRAVSMACKTVHGSRSIHSVRSVGPSNNVQLEAKDYSCFCFACVARPSQRGCPNVMYSQPWVLKTLEPISSDVAVQEGEDLEQDWTTAPGSNDLAVNLNVGDHFAVLADPEDQNAHGAEFFVLVCTRELYIVDEDELVDSWNVVVERDDEVVEGMYYHQSGLKENSYNLVGSAGPARIYSHLVIASKFSMTLQRHRQKGCRAVYHLSNNALEKIERAIREREQIDALERENSDDDGDETDDGDPSDEDSDSESNL